MIAFTSEGGNSDGTYFNRNASGNLEILAAGTYFFHLIASTLPATPAGSSSVMLLRWNVVAGSDGFWTSRGVGLANEGNSFAGNIIQDNNARAIAVRGAMDLLGMAQWTSTDTFPVEIQCITDWQVDTVGTAADADYAFGALRLGDSFE